ncbi:MAG TPA: TolC family protein [Kofleriaceae bacterium]|nr:TolC family protein [Kofleriaceae bacterium]
MRFLVLLLIGALALPAHADVALPRPLRVEDVVSLARSRRAEITAAQAKARAAGHRPKLVSALDDPMVSFSVDHLPFNGMGMNWSVTFQQTFPLSHVRGNRERGAEAGARRELADAERVQRDVELDAAEAFWMLAEARAVVEIVGTQYSLADQLVKAATARYSANMGTQSDVLRAQIEVSRLDAERRATAAEVRAAEVMLNTSIARDADAPIPDLDATVPEVAPPTPDSVARSAAKRPELRAGRAEIEQAEAERRVMGSMYAPMAMVQTGPAYTMTESYGWMAMVGISIPLWRGKLKAGTAEADAMVDMAKSDLEAMQRMADGQARQAREKVVAARERYLALRDDVVPRAEQAIAPTLAAYSAGQVPLVSVVEAAQALWSAQRELVMARAELGLAWARLRRASTEEITP